jgi:hypothetical protein
MKVISGTFEDGHAVILAHKDSVLVAKDKIKYRYPIAVHVDQRQFWLKIKGQWLESEEFDLTFSQGYILPSKKK